jgi:hypothetical protein
MKEQLEKAIAKEIAKLERQEKAVQETQNTIDALREAAKLKK